MSNKVIVRILLSSFGFTGNTTVKLDFANIVRFDQKIHQTINIMGNIGFPDKKLRMSYGVNTNFFIEGSGLGRGTNLAYFKYYYTSSTPTSELVQSIFTGAGTVSTWTTS